MAEAVGEYDKKRLPFDGVELTPYLDYMRKEIIDKAIKRGLRLFFIKRNKPNGLFCDAVGYYNRLDRSFVLLAYSDLAISSDFDFYNSVLSIERKRLMKRDCTVENGRCYLNKDVVCRGAAVAASYVIGRRAKVGEWLDKNGKSLPDYYPELLPPKSNNWLIDI